MGASPDRELVSVVVGSGITHQGASNPPELFAFPSGPHQVHLGDYFMCVHVGLRLGRKARKNQRCFMPTDPEDVPG